MRLELHMDDGIMAVEADAAPIVEALRGMGDGLRWSVDPPTAPGWYWARYDSDVEPQVVRVLPVAHQNGNALIVDTPGARREWMSAFAFWWPVAVVAPPVVKSEAAP